MSELIDRIPGEQSVVASLRGVVEDSLQFKAAQRFSGRSGQLGYLVESDDDWDLILPLYSAPPAYTAATLELRYVSDGTQDYPIVVPVTDIRVNGTGEANRMQVVPSSGLFTYSDGSGDVIVQTWEYADPNYFGHKSEARWKIDFLFRGNVTLRIKTRARATSDGTMSVVRTA